MGNLTSKVSKSRRSLAHEMFVHVIHHHVVHARLGLRRVTELSAFRDAFTPGELKHIKETLELLDEAHRRICTIDYRLKFNATRRTHTRKRR